MVKFEIRQHIGTVNRKWLEVIASSELERPIRMDYNRLVSENPAEYFELVKIDYSEECIDFTVRNSPQNKY